ncbi:phosphotransferase family protein [Dactylonectria macrodidyma]|uniref:Phosphotransferase family protein n=1 Tax=Dactylonectria macrodidyma TaxID=307937 RepID=A0A9P9EHR2_9HYPO|nr:phosphotransferase family protein [Dactylonectria macrodidyma]
MAVPSSDVLEAFGIVDDPIPLPEGRGICYRAGDIILKPSDNNEEAEWISSLTESLFKRQPSVYRVSCPKEVLGGSTQRFVYSNWTAWSVISGKTASKDAFEAILVASHELHTDLATLRPKKPPFLSQIENRWMEADRVTWDEKRLEDVGNVNADVLALIQPFLQRLWQMKKPILEGMKDQLIHGDMTGNVLFDHNRETPPGIIDITPYWRPAQFAEAIVVADGLVWHSRGRELVDVYGTGNMRLQLLVRALYWRCLTFAIDSDVEWVREHLPHANFNMALTIVTNLLEI